MLDKVNTHLRTILNVNQWRNTQNVIEWFGNIEQKSRHSFISFNIVDFYPSISEYLLDQALSWASRLADISHEDISIIKHAKKSLLFNNGKKNNNSNLFDVTMGSYDGAEICELVGLFILNHLGKSFGKENIGLYRDDGLAIIKNKSARLTDKSVWPTRWMCINFRSLLNYFQWNLIRESSPHFQLNSSKARFGLISTISIQM